MDIVLRATAMFAILFLLLRLLGKRELGQMTPFEFVVLVVMGDLIQQGVTHNDFSLTGATLAIVTFAFWGLVLMMAVTPGEVLLPIYLSASSEGVAALGLLSLVFAAGTVLGMAVFTGLARAGASGITHLRPAPE